MHATSDQENASSARAVSCTVTLSSAKQCYAVLSPLTATPPVPPVPPVSPVRCGSRCLFQCLDTRLTRSSLPAYVPVSDCFHACLLLHASCFMANVAFVSQPQSRLSATAQFETATAPAFSPCHLRVLLMVQSGAESRRRQQQPGRMNSSPLELRRRVHAVAGRHAL